MQEEFSISVNHVLYLIHVGFADNGLTLVVMIDKTSNIAPSNIYLVTIFVQTEHYVHCRCSLHVCHEFCKLRLMIYIQAIDKIPCSKFNFES